MTLYVPGGETAPIYPAESGLPTFEILPVRPEHASTARCYVSTKSKAHGVLLQASRLGCPTVDQLRQFVASATGACTTREDLDSKAASMLEYDAVRKQAMMKQQSFASKPLEDLATRVGELTFMDYHGPYQEAAIATNGAKGLLGIVDEYSDSAIVSLAKSRTTEAWLEMVSAAQLIYKHAGHELQMVLTDRAPELIQQLIGGDGLDLSKWEAGLLEKGILAYFSKRYQPQPHGRIEIVWQHAKNTGRAWMVRTMYNNSFFLWACWAAVKVRESLIGRTKNESRCMLFNGKPYDGSMDKVWGSPGYAWIPPEARAHPAAPVSVKCVFVGLGTDGWRVIIGHGATAKWMDVTRADFYEVGLITKGLMPGSAQIDQETQTDEEVVVPDDVQQHQAAHVHDEALPAIREKPADWRSSLRPREPVTLLSLAAQARNLEVESQLIEWAIQANDASMERMAVAELRYGASVVTSQHNVPPPAQAGFTLITKRQKKPIMVWFDSTHGRYSLVKPQSFNEAMAGEHAAKWHAACFADIVESEAKGLFVPMPVNMVPAGVSILPSTWSFDYKKNNANEFVARKVRPSADGRREEDIHSYSAPAPMIECLAAICASVKEHRFVAGADLAKGFTSALRPGGIWKYMHMLQGFVRYDMNGVKMVYGLPTNYWGEKSGGRVFEDHKNGEHKLMGFGPAPDCVNTWRKPTGGTTVYTTNVTDDFYVQSSIKSALDTHYDDLKRHFPYVKWCMYPTQFNGLKLTWVLNDEGLPISCTVACPTKIAALVEMLGGIQDIRGRVGKRKLTHELMAEAEVLADELTERGRMTRKGTGLVQWISPVRLDTKAFVQVLSRVMAAPSAAAATLLDLVAIGLYETDEDGLTYTTGELTKIPVDTKYRTLDEAFDMALGSPSHPMMAFDSTWGEVRKSVASFGVTCAGAAVDATTLTIPTSALSSAEAETYAFSWAVARSTFALGALASLGVAMPDKVCALGDNSATMDMAAKDATVTNARHFQRRVAFNQDACDEETGMFVPIKVPTAKNPVDYMGKLVPRDKIEGSLNWLMGKHRQPTNKVLKEAASSRPV